MIFVNEEKFQKLNGENGRALVNTVINILSAGLEIVPVSNSGVEGITTLTDLRPSKDLLELLKAGEITKKKFQKAYFKELKQDEKMFLIYMIMRGMKENKYLPIFVCTDNDWELGFMKVLKKFFKKTFKINSIDVKEYLKTNKKLYEDAKKEKKSKKWKIFKGLVRDYIKDFITNNFDGVEAFEKLEKKFAIHRSAILINQATDDTEEINKKAIIKSIELYRENGKKAEKFVKEAVRTLGISKKEERWSKKDAINLVMKVYNLIIDADEKKD